MFSPTSNLRLLSVPLGSDYSNTLWFPSVENQTAYFTGKTVKTYENFNYIKKNNTVVVSDEIDNLYNCNYVMYRNGNFTNRWFYAFITKMEWASNSSTRLYLTTDVIQTWFFNITYYQSYVDRCHSDTDNVGDNIVPENFTGASQGGYCQIGSQDLEPDWVTVFATTDYDGNPLDPYDLTGIVSGAGSAWTGKYDKSKLASLLSNYVKNGNASAISRIQQWPSHSASISFLKYPSSINGYVPENNKLRSGAFINCYMTMYGQEIDFSPEYITDSTVQAKLVSDNTSGTVACIVTNYSSSDIPNINMTAVVPESTWAYNQYKNDYNLHSGSNSIYVERAKTDRNLGMITSGLNTAVSALGAASAFANAVNPVSSIVGAVTGNGSNTLNEIARGVSGISSAIQSATPLYYGVKGIDEVTQDLTAISESYNAPATGGVASSNLYIAAKKTALSYGYKVPPLDIVKRYDKYLTVYGYKQSCYRDINLHARASWTYIKTLGLNASGNFPQEDMNVIKQIFDQGVFFWSYTATFGNFTQPNGIV
jgi:hypothetical protein